MQNERAVCKPLLETVMSQNSFSPEISCNQTSPIFRSELFLPLPPFKLPDHYLSVSLECGAPLPLLLRNTGAGTRLLLQSIKKAARFLKQFTGFQQTRCLEILASIVGFSSWYELNKYLASIQYALDIPADVWLTRLKPALPFMVCVSPGIGPRPFAIEKMESLAEALSIEIGIDRNILLDTVFAKICHCNNWSMAKERSPTQQDRPTYEFVHVEDGSSYLKANLECQSLFITLGGFGFWDAGSENFKLLLPYMVEFVHRNYGFLPGWLWVSECLIDSNPDMSLYHASEGVRHAEFFIPSDYAGKLSWFNQDNRVYLKLLLTKLKVMVKLCADGDNYQDEVKILGEKILSLTEKDYFKISEILSKTLTS
jgi:hypothetical protein